MAYILRFIFILCTCSTDVIGLVYFTNATTPLCMSIYLNVDFPNGLVLMKLNNDTGMFAIIRNNSNDILGQNEGISNVSVDLNNNSISFCLQNTTKYYAGTYSIFLKTNVLGISTLYILDKPHQATIAIEENGTVNDQPGRLRCRAKSTSLPSGLNFTYIWKVNDKIIEVDTKYNFSQSRSVLYIQTSRNEKINNYSCIAVESRGSASDPSLPVTVDAYRTPIVNISPNESNYRVIKNGNVTLTCTVIDGHPSVFNFTWYRNNNDMTVASEPTLHLSNIDEGGSYSCKAYNVIGGDQSSAIFLDILSGPNIQSIPTQFKEEGSNFTIECNVSSYPVVYEKDVIWTRSGDSVFNRTGRSLHIQNLKKNDQTQYTCTASVVFYPSSGPEKTNTSFTSFNLEVLFGPDIELISTYKQIEGESTKIVCNVSSNPLVADKDIKWTKDGRSIFNGSHLIFPSVKRTDDGQYNCSVEVLLNVSVGGPVKRYSTKAVVLDVLYGPLVLLNYTFKEIQNRPINISCNVRSNPVPAIEDIQWLRNGVHIQSGPYLWFASASLNHDGVYNCSVNLTLKPTENKSVDRSASSSVFIDILYGPEVTNYNATPTVEGEVLKIACIITSNPKATDTDVIWTKSGNSSFQKSGVEFELNFVSRRDIGLYICNVSITLEPSKGHPEAKHIAGIVNVTVYYPPNILSVTNVTIYEGNQTQINCSVDGNPTPRFIWTYVENGSFIKEYNRSHDHLISTSSILLSSARCEDTGTYMCLANNSIKSASNKTSAIIVKCQPRLRYSGSLNITISRNETLNETIEFHAVPAPTFTWSFNNSELGDFNVSYVNDSLPFLFGSRIEKNDFDELNIGQYSLKATNEIGSAYETVYISYHREPNRPYFVDLNCNDVKGTAIVVWKSGFSELPQHFNILYRLSNEMNFSKSDIYSESEMDNSYTEFVSNLRENGIYIFKIKATNNLGYKESQERNCTIAGSTKQSLLLSIIGGVSGSIAGIAVVIVVVLVLKYRRKSNDEKEPLRRTTTNCEEDDDEGLRDNPLYAQSDSIDACAIFNSKEKTNKQTDDKKGKRKDKPKGGGKHIELKDVYENSEDIVKIHRGPVYGNVKSNISFPENNVYLNKKNKDGLLYADLEFNPSTSTFVVHGLENRNIYADIDLNKKAEPLPSDSDSEIDNN